MEKWILNKKNLILDSLVTEIKKDEKIALSDFTLKYLILNGFDTPKKIKEVMYFRESDIPECEGLKDVEKFTNRCFQALTNDEKVVIYGDYDNDGISATAIAMRGFRNLNIQVDYFINNRFTEGYGICKKGIDRMLGLYPNTKLIITLDNGINAFEGIDYARSLGIDVIVADHHEPKEDGSLPNALAIVDAKRLDDTYPFKDLCGAGLIYKLLCHMYRLLSLDVEQLHYLLAYVASATIGDVVSLTFENRYYVKEGIKEVKEENLLCFKTLNTLNKVSDVTEETFGYLYVPIINAVGRMEGNVDLAVEFYLCDDVIKSEYLAKKLIEINKQRKNLCASEQEKAEKALALHPKQRAIVLVMEDLHEGIVGIVAGRLKEKYQCPVLVLTKVQGEDIYKGSGRSVQGFNLKKALDLLSADLIGYGGHELAAGLSLKKDKLNNFREAFYRLADDETFNHQDKNKRLVVDFALKEQDLSLRMIYALNTELRPFGAGFPIPVIGLQGFEVEKECSLPTNALPEDRKHVKLSNGNVEVIWFNGWASYQALGKPKRIKCIGFPSVNFFRNKQTIQFRVENNRIRES